MRDTFLGLNQKKVLELKNMYVDGKGESLIRTDDLILMRRIQDFVASSKTYQVVLESEVYYWINYEVFYEDLPMIFTSVKSVKKKMERLKVLGLVVNKLYRVTKKVVEETKGTFFKNAGTYSLVRITQLGKSLFDFTTEVAEKPIISCIGGNSRPRKSKGFTLEGVKGLPNGGVKGYPHGGVNKEYLEINTYKIDRSEPTKTEKESINPERVKLKDNFLKFIDIVSKSCGEVKERIRMTITLSLFDTIDIVEVLKEIDKSKFLRGECNKKPSITNFSRINMLKKIVVGEYRDKEDTNTPVKMVRTKRRVLN